jgi:SAM-dependent methyltransferase
MTDIFDKYSLYYDLLYKDKNYAEEVDYVVNLIGEHRSLPKAILELGCGTGKHAYFLKQKGIDVEGIDISESMLNQAKKMGMNCQLGDARSYRSGKKFDAVISLFHVASYQTSNVDLYDYFNSAAVHLNKSGVFVFDCWYGPCVVSLKPEYREKYMENDAILVKRKSFPHIFPNDNSVEVEYSIEILDKKLNITSVIQEKHRMRYLFKPEVEFFLKQVGLKLVKHEEWMTKKELGFDTWCSVFVGKKV